MSKAYENRKYANITLDTGKKNTDTLEAEKRSNNNSFANKSYNGPTLGPKSLSLNKVNVKESVFGWVVYSLILSCLLVVQLRGLHSI